MGKNGFLARRSLAFFFITLLFSNSHISAALAEGEGAALMSGGAVIDIASPSSGTGFSYDPAAQTLSITADGSYTVTGSTAANKIGVAWTMGEV